MPIRAQVRKAFVTQRIPLFAANWKMNKQARDAAEFLGTFPAMLVDFPKQPGYAYEVAIAPQTVYLEMLGRHLLGKPIKLAAQNCGPARSGAFTGETSPSALKELGVEWVILGHSERRHVFGEDDARVLSRLKAALEEKLGVILCVGETLAQRKADETFSVVESQLAILLGKEAPAAGFWEKVVLAYEPVWAIGTGENATPAQAQEVHARIRSWIAKHFGEAQANKVRVLYGGSVKPENSGSLMAQPDVDGLLVGTSSLDAAVFAGVIKNGLVSPS